MNAFAVFSALLLTLAAGSGITLPLLAKRGKIHLTELAALSWLLGAAFISLVVWAAGLVMPGTWIPAPAAAGCVALFCGGIHALRKGNARMEWPRQWSTRDLLLCGFLALEFAVMLRMAWKASMWWDGLFAWEWKARMAFLYDGHLPPYYYLNAEWHPDYPLFLPANEMWLYLWAGGADQFWVRIFFPPFYIAAALLLYTGCTQLAGSRTAGLIAACMLFFVPEAMTGPGAFDSGYADFPLAVFYLAAAVQLLVFLRNDTRSLPLFAVLAGVLPWIKRDGDVLWACIVLAGGAIAAFRRRPATVLLGIAAPGIAVIGAWTIFLKAMHTAKNIDFLPLTPANLRQNIGRVIPIARRLAHEPFFLDRWSLVWIGFAAAIIYLALTKRAKPAALCLLLTMLPVLLFCASFLFSAWPDYTRHVDSSLARIILQVTPVALLAIGMALAGRNKPQALPVVKNQPAGAGRP